MHTIEKENMLTLTLDSNMDSMKNKNLKTTVFSIQFIIATPSAYKIVTAHFSSQLDILQ